jgi:Chlorophyllase enzyme
MKRTIKSGVLTLLALGSLGACAGASDDALDDGEEVAASESETGASAGPQQLMFAAEGDATSPSGLPPCRNGSVEPCGTFITAAGVELPLGPYGAVMERNVGRGFANRVSILDTEAACRSFATSFGGDPADQEELLALGDLNLSLYTVYRPAKWVDGETYPIVTWGNGTCAQPEGYGALLRYVASQGYVVVAPNSRYVGSGNEQRRALDWLTAANRNRTSPYYRRLDTSKIAAMGHSQGSGGTIAAASDTRIKTVILFNGGTSARKPFFAFSGDRDIGDPTPSSYRNAVDQASKAAFLFFHKVPQRGNGDGHLTLMTQPERVAPAAAAWLKYVLSGDASYRSWFVGADCKLCGDPTEYEFGQKGL